MDVVNPKYKSTKKSSNKQLFSANSKKICTFAFWLTFQQNTSNQIEITHIYGIPHHNTHH